MQKRLCLFFCLLLICYLPVQAFAQTTTTSTSTTVTDGLALADKALFATGSSAAVGYQDAEAIGTISVPSNDPIPVTIRTLGRTAVHVEAKLKDGTAVRIVNGGKGVYTRADGKQRQLADLNLVTERVNYIPALSFLADAHATDISVTAAGTDTVKGTTVDVVAIAVSKGADDAQIAACKEVTQRKYFIDRSTGLVLKVEYTHFAEDGAPGRAEVFYSDYRTVSGMEIPFRQATYINGKLLSELTLQSVTFNVGLSSADFVVPEVQQ